MKEKLFLKPSQNAVQIKNKPLSRSLTIVTCVAAALLVGCSNNGDSGWGATETNTVGGTALGAGLGAIVGHETGHTGAGIAVGAAAGALGGALLGSQTDKQDRARREQDERIRRQEEELERQRRDLEEMRRQRGDYGSGYNRYDSYDRR